MGHCERRARRGPGTFLIGLRRTRRTNFEGLCISWSFVRAMSSTLKGNILQRRLHNRRSAKQPSQLLQIAICYRDGVELQPWMNYMVGKVKNTYGL